MHVTLIWVVFTKVTVIVLTHLCKPKLSSLFFLESCPFSILDLPSLSISILFLSEPVTILVFNLLNQDRPTRFYESTFIYCRYTLRFRCFFTVFQIEVTREFLSFLGFSNCIRFFGFSLVHATVLTFTCNRFLTVVLTACSVNNCCHLYRSLKSPCTLF